MDNGIEEEGCARAQANFSVRRPDVGVISTGVAHVLTWLAALLLVFAPIYQGVSVTPVTSGGAASESVRFTSTLVEVNGLSVLPLLLVPVALTALGLDSRPGDTYRVGQAQGASMGFSHTPAGVLRCEYFLHRAVLLPCGDRACCLSFHGLTAQQHQPSNGHLRTPP